MFAADIYLCYICKLQRTSKQSGPRKPRKKKSVASILTNLNDKDIVAYSLDPIDLEEKSECEIKISECNIAESHGVTVMKSSVNEYETMTTAEFLEKELTLLKNVHFPRITEKCKNVKETTAETKSKIIQSECSSFVLEELKCSGPHI